MLYKHSTIIKVQWIKGAQKRTSIIKYFLKTGILIRTVIMIKEDS